MLRISSEHREVGEALTWSVRRWPLVVALPAALIGLYACANPTAKSANNQVSQGRPVVSPSTPVVSASTPVVGLAPPRPTVCQPILSAADLADVASETDAVVEGDSPGKTSVVVDSDASQFDVTKILKAVPGVDPTGAIEIIFGPRGTGYFLPPGKYLLFLQYNPIAKVYTIHSGGVGSGVINAEFLINGDTATEQSCGSGPSDGAEPSAVASWNAADGAPPMSESELEAWVAQLSLGGVTESPVAAGSPTEALSIGSFDGTVKIAAPRSGDRPRTTETGAEARLENATVFGEAPLGTVPRLELARVTVGQDPALPHTWKDRLAWIVVLQTPVEDLSMCPVSPANPDQPPAGPQQHIYAVDATGIGDGIIYTGPGISCGRRVPAMTEPLAHLWSAPWQVTATGPTSVTLGFQPPPCGTEYSFGAVSLQPYQIAMLYAVPFSTQDCPSPTPAAQSLTVPGNYSDPTPAPPNVEQPRFGYVRQTANGLLPELPE